MNISYILVTFLGKTFWTVINRVDCSEIGDKQKQTGQLNVWHNIQKNVIIKMLRQAIPSA